MKRLLATSLALAMAMAALDSADAVAQPYGPPGGPPPPGFRPPPGPPPGPGYGPPRWHHGDRFDGHRRVIDWRYYRLRPPPYGYEWIQDRGQFVLIGVNTGFVVDVR